MEVFLVRHGRTDGNDARRHQHPQTHLNEIGQAQAKAVADLIKAQKPTYLITSTNVRAVQSAVYIATACDLIPETYSPFEELHQPSYLIGQRLTGPTAMMYMLRWFIGSKTAAMHDGETYQAFVSRLAEARAHLEQLPVDSRVVIVSHSVFINFFVEHMVRPEKMGWARAGILFIKLLKMRNSSVTHVRYAAPAASQSTYHKTGWHLVRFH